MNKIGRILCTLIALFAFVSFCKAQQGKMRPLNDLVNPEESSWEQIKQWTDAATNKIKILPKDNLRADSALYAMQLSTSSPVGAMIYNCGGILVENGWIRILGSGCKQLDRGLPEWNKGKAFNKYGESPSFLLVADDVYGGFFAVNTGGIDKYDLGKVYYFGPNTLKWKTTGLGYSEFLVFCFSGDIEKFYKGFRWKGWEEEIGKLTGNQVISCYPLLWTDSGRDLHHNIIPVQKQWEFYQKKKPAAKRSQKKSTLVAKK